MLLSLVSTSFPFITPAAAAASSQPSLTLLPLFFLFSVTHPNFFFFFQSLPRPLTSPHLWSFLRLHLFILLQHLSENFTFHTHLSLAFPGRTSVPTILLLSQCYTHLYHRSLCSPPSIRSYFPPLFSIHITRKRVIEMYCWVEQSFHPVFFFFFPPSVLIHSTLHWCCNKAAVCFYQRCGGKAICACMKQQWGRGGRMWDVKVGLKEIHSVEPRGRQWWETQGLMERVPRGMGRQACPQSTQQPRADPSKPQSPAPLSPRCSLRTRAAGRLEASD